VLGAEVAQIVCERIDQLPDGIINCRRRPAPLTPVRAKWRSA
jgi:hypothetical protein